MLEHEGGGVWVGVRGARIHLDDARIYNMDIANARAFHVRTHAHTHTHTHTHTHFARTHARTHIHIHTNTHSHSLTHAHVANGCQQARASICVLSTRAERLREHLKNKPFEDPLAQQVLQRCGHRHLLLQGRAFGGFGVWGVGFGVWGLGFEVWGVGVGSGVWGLGFGVYPES
jgi:hypothetical protein